MKQSTTVPGRIPSLDGVRAVSIIFVMLSHLATSGTLPIMQHLWRFDLGALGVRVFFVVSGFLITSLLIVEFCETGTISLRGFYIRRFFRIMPAFWFLLALVSFAIPFGLVSASFEDVGIAGIYVANYLSLQFSLGHTWSLAVEEQFYLLWPALIIMFGWRRASYFACAALVMAPVLRLLCEFGVWPTNPRYAFETVCDALASGCLLAICRDRLWRIETYRSIVMSGYFFLIPLSTVALLAMNLPEAFRALIGLTCLNFTIVMVLDRLIRQPNDLVGRVLNSWPFRKLGLLSYSLYLWQQLFLGAAHPIVFPVNVLLVLLVAVFSYYGIERPFLAIGRRIYSRRALVRDSTK